MSDNSIQLGQAAQAQGQTSPDSDSSERVSGTAAQGATASPSKETKAFGTIEWPVPHVMVSFRGLQMAYGREGIAKLGRLACHTGSLRPYHIVQAKSRTQGFTKELFATMLWKPALFEGTQQHALDTAYERSMFGKTVILLGSFYAVHGKGDVGPVILGHIGWAEMVGNLVSITLEFEDEPEMGSGWD